LDERLHKLLAQHGIGSRRQVESWIQAGRVQVNGQPAVIGQRVGPRDRVVVDGRDVTKRLAGTQSLRVIVYHKPSGEMLRQHEGDERLGVDTRLPTLRAGRWVPVNSLGYGEDGLLILTDDGALAAAAAKRGRAMPVEYRVRALRPRDAESWPVMPGAVEVAGDTVDFSSVERLEGGTTNAWFRITADRALPRGAIRALFDDAGLKLNRVMLVRWGPAVLPRDLPRGRSRDLVGGELDTLLEIAGRRGAGKGADRAQSAQAGKGRAGRKSTGDARAAGRTAGLRRPAGRRSGGR
jgi:23S rRNA pseudouridine2605 synthase